MGTRYPRNMMVQEESERVLLIDFDSAEMLPEDVKLLTPTEKSWIRAEDRMIDVFTEDLVSPVHT